MLAIDLFCGLGGWAEGFLAEGYQVFGFDIEHHDYGTGTYPGEFVMQDVLTLHGSQFKGATVIVASPPCQAYSYRMMPWKRAKALPPPDNTLFEACFRLQREASEAAGRLVPLIVENVCGAQKWVGRAGWHFGSFYLWGDIPALMPFSRSRKLNAGNFHRNGAPKWSRFAKTGEVSPHWRMEKGRNSNDLRRMQCTAAVGAPMLGEPGMRLPRMPRDGEKGIPHKPTGHWTNPDENGTRQGGDWFGKNCETSMSRMYGSKTSKRKAASAEIAKIPFPLAQHIARSFKP